MLHSEQLVSCRKSWLWFAIGAVCCAVWLMPHLAFAQTAQPNVRVRARFERAVPPEVIDMQWARGGPWGPAHGKSIQVFVLLGALGRQGCGDSRLLSRDIRAGSPNILFFEEGGWHPLKPLGVRYGVEIPFARHVAAACSGETIGVICAPSVERALAHFRDAQKAASCSLVAWISATNFSLKREDIQQRVHLPDLIVVESAAIALPESMCESMADVTERGVRLASQVLQLIKTKK